MLEDDERELLDNVVATGDFGYSPLRGLEALDKLLKYVDWLSSAGFGRALASTIQDSTTTVLKQKGEPVTHAREIGRNSSQTVMMLIEAGPEGELAKGT